MLLGHLTAKCAFPHFTSSCVRGGVLNIIHAHSALFFSALLTNRAYYCWMFEGCVHWQVQQ